MANDNGTGPVRLGTLVAEGKTVWCFCRTCGHDRDVPSSSLPLPHKTPVQEIGKRMICSRCGSREITTWPEVYPGGFEAMRSRYR